MSDKTKIEIVTEQDDVEDVEAAEDTNIVSDDKWEILNTADQMLIGSNRLKHDSSSKASLTILKLAERLRIFKDQYGEIFVFYDGRVIPIDDNEFSELLVRLYFDLRGTFPSRNAVKKVVSLLSAKTKHEGETLDLCLRIAEKEEVIYYDMGGDRLVRVSRDGWSIEAVTPMFYSYLSHQRVQVEPVGGGDIWKLFKYLNVSENFRLLLVCYIVSCFRPNIIKPILHVVGGNGSGKSTLCRVLKDLVDPCRSEFTNILGNEADILYSTLNNYYMIFDDVMDVPDNKSEFLLRLSNGLDFKRRGKVINVKLRNICLNGSGWVLGKDDIRDHMLVLPLEPMEDGTGVSDDEFWGAFNADKPLILGAVLDILAQAMATYQYCEDEIKTDLLPYTADVTAHMNDFAVFGAAVAVAIGYPYKDFLVGYCTNSQVRVDYISRENRLLQSMVGFMSDKPKYESLISTFYAAIKDCGTGFEGDRTFPKDDSKLMGALRKIEDSLKAHGITFYRKVTNKGNRITLIKEGAEVD
ncbi:hypothetical protein MBAV_001913 [Candidatus Magnetobacterium bavaricum]|uniref:ATP-binding protein n=1 Tax=Candidatus Magnetobacterium bavaricum TaxID=29290 RepID=A0A0F3GYY6_9BACT|nr:hypothetical protein MBAV_001913 [Candidatus Magnetobacterium bavaricum]